MRTFIILGLISVLIQSCGEHKDTTTSQSADVVAGGFVPDELFKYSDDVTTIEAKAAASQITALNFFYFNKSEASTSLELAETPDVSTEPACEVKQDEVIVSDSGKELTVKYAFDDTACEKASSPFLNIVKVLIRISCAKTNLADYAKSSARDLLDTNGARDFCPSDETQRTFVNAEYERIGKEYSAKAIGGIMKPDGSPCVASFKDGTYTLNNCNFYRRVEKTKLADQSTSVGTMIKLEAKVLQHKSEGRFYDGGSVVIRFNNWSGEMNYTSASMAPKYSITNGKETVKGGLTAGLYQ